MSYTCSYIGIRVLYFLTFGEEDPTQTTRRQGHWHININSQYGISKCAVLIGEIMGDVSDYHLNAESPTSTPRALEINLRCDAVTLQSNLYITIDSGVRILTVNLHILLCRVPHFMPEEGKCGAHVPFDP
jgi:hypothetical protein